MARGPANVKAPAARGAAAAAALAVLAAAALLAAPAAASDAAWRPGRATFYGNEPWYWDIHHGSCGFGYMWPDQSTGWDVAALADTHPNYSGSCGRCYEVRCDPRPVRDGYGETLDRSRVCHGGSVVVRTTDTCPCNYAGNYYSNKRWCCGDQDHFDVSWGVVPIQYRQVDCAHKPDHQASAASFPGVFPPEHIGRQRPDFDWYFPNGGYTSITSGSSHRISTADYVARLRGGGGGGGGGGKRAPDGGGKAGAGWGGEPGSGGNAQYGK
ncbi:U6 snRNA phosphodiesterase [Raphidocelis subcapitata]|uniref:U6 snRNA phosphodiesterase n=1 Tax=Raphidocelis subcapitata TaxID=307507 RepID=A0A2V0PF54_9CHLO|nr:U6 snRNA phosphodiesterase [Raphidocelis subcapitata]|eukprot:GBF98478.1 U6 snRNA phosphodiesterase [Raphidocelis subcapitata]